MGREEVVTKVALMTDLSDPSEFPLSKSTMHLLLDPE